MTGLSAADFLAMHWCVCDHPAWAAGWCVWLLLYPKHLQHASRRAWPPGSCAVSCELKSQWSSLLCTAHPSVLPHQELPWKLSCDYSAEPSTSISIAEFGTIQHALPPALQCPEAAPNAGEPSPGSHQQQWCQHSWLLGTHVHKPGENLVIFSMTH